MLDVDRQHGEVPLVVVVNVNVDNLPEGVWHDFSLQVLTRLFAHLTSLASGEPMDRMLTTLGDQAAIQPADGPQEGRRPGHRRDSRGRTQGQRKVTTATRL